MGWQRAVPAAGLIGVCAAASLTDVSADEGQIFCPFRVFTGGWCPGCGGTRALKYMVRGDVSTSLALNPFLLVVLAQAIAISAAFLAVPDKARVWFRDQHFRLLQANIVVGLVIWVVRLATDRIPMVFEVDAPIVELVGTIF